MARLLSLAPIALREIKVNSLGKSQRNIMGMTEGNIVGQAVMPDRVKEFIHKELLAEFH